MDTRPFWRDDQIVVDKDGIPHYTGSRPELMKDYRRRVLFAWNNLEGSGDDEEKEKKSLAKKQRRFAKRLMDNLHDEAWRVCQDLLTSEKLRSVDGYKEVLRCLQKIEKVTVLKKTEAFDNLLDRTYRKRGQSIDQYLRHRSESWADLTELAEGVAMSEDLLAYFLLKNVNLTKEEKRQVLLANQSDYSLAGFEKALRVSFFDIHEREKNKEWPQPNARRVPKGGGKRFHAHAVEESSREPEYEEAPEDDYPEETEDFYANAADGEEAEPEDEDHSDAGASDDDDVFQAYATYRESRKKLKDIQKSRGFHRPKTTSATPEQRKAAIEKEKARSRCSACGRLGHWAGDAACEKGGKSQAGKGKGPGGKGRGQPKGKAYLVGEQPLFFSLRDPGEEGAAFMVQDGNLVQGGKGDETPMEQDAGRTELDDKRKKPAVYASTAEWDYIPAPFVNEDPDRERLLEKATDPTPEQIGDRIPEQVVIDVPREKIEEFRVPSLTMVIPKNLSEMKVRQLQEECDRWGIQTSGRKDEILSRLQNLYNGQPVHKKGCSTRFVRLLLGPVPAGRPGTSKDTVPTERSDSETKKVAGTFRARGAVGSDNATASRPTTSHGYASAGQPSGQSRGPAKPGRSPTEDEKHPGPAFSPDGQQFDPKTGTVIPKVIKFNQPCPSIRCGADGHPMVLRRGFNLFFGCSSFPTCQFTRTLQEGLAHHSASKGG